MPRWKRKRNWQAGWNSSWNKFRVAAVKARIPSLITNDYVNRALDIVESAGWKHPYSRNQATRFLDLDFGHIPNRNPFPMTSAFSVTDFCCGGAIVSQLRVWPFPAAIVTRWTEPKPWSRCRRKLIAFLLHVRVINSFSIRIMQLLNN
jgi:hypothetical protein